MLRRQPEFLRPPLATRQRLNNTSMDSELPEAQHKHHWNLESNQTSLESSNDVYMQQEEDAKTIYALENASRLYECAWNGCYAKLGSWELLKRHVGKMHCEALSKKTLERASSSRPYRCCYGSCQNRTFSDPFLLLQHVVSGHLESLKLRCPFGCKQPIAKLQSLAQHLFSTHEKKIDVLPGAQMRSPPPRRVSLPELPTSDAPMGLDCISHVEPCSTFDSSKVKIKSRTDPWADFEEFDDGKEMGRFTRLRDPPTGLMTSDMRMIPRGRIMYDGLQRPEGGCEAARRETRGETLGYEVWKARFEEEADVAEMSERNKPRKRKKM